MKKSIPLNIDKKSWSVAIAAVKIGSAFEVSNLDELLDLNRSVRPEVLVDMEGKLRVVLVVRGSIFVSKPVDVRGRRRAGSQVPRRDVRRLGPELHRVEIAK